VTKQLLSHFDREGIIWRCHAPSSQKLLLLALNSFVDGEGKCYPGVERLAQMMGASTATVKRAIRELESEGIINRQSRRAGGKQTSNLYTVDFGKISSSFCTPEVSAAQNEPRSAAQNEPRSAAQNDPRSIQGLTVQGLTVQNSSSADRDRNLGGPKPTPFFESSRTVRRIEHVQSIPRWDINAPWPDDEQRKAFDGWLRRKYKAKHDPARYAATIVSATAKGQPSVDWEEFSAHPQSMEQQDRQTEVLKQWGDRQDWENFPLLAEWQAKCEEIGWLEFTNLGGRFSPHHRFADWHRGLE
jgi:biotin operon repressor